MLTLNAGPTEILTLPRLTSHEVSNPSLVRIGEGRFHVAYKGVNYNLKKSGYGSRTYAGFRVPFSDAQNYFAIVDWSSEPKIERSGFLEDRHLRTRPVAQAGLQDLRLFVWNGRLHALAGVHAYPADAAGARAKQTRMMLCTLDGHQLNFLAMLPHRQPKEKNWMPWPRGEALYLQYHCDPYEVLKVQDRRVSVAAGPRKVPGLEGFFGGSPILPLGRHFIGIVHLKVLDHPVTDTYPLAGMGYFHKAVIYGPDLEVLDVSAFFRFEGERVEFCCGLALDADAIVFSYGVWDVEARLMRMKTREFLQAVGLARWMPDR